MGCGSKIKDLLNPLTVLNMLTFDAPSKILEQQNRDLRNILSFSVNLTQQVSAEAGRLQDNFKINFGPMPTVGGFLSDAIIDSIVDKAKITENVVTKTAEKITYASDKATRETTKALADVKKVTETAQLFHMMTSGIGIIEHTMWSAALESEENPLSDEWWGDVFDLRQQDVRDVLEMQEEFYSLFGASGMNTDFYNFDTAATEIAKLAAHGDTTAWKTIAVFTVQISRIVWHIIANDWTGAIAIFMGLMDMILEITELGEMMNDIYRGINIYDLMNMYRNSPTEMFGFFIGNFKYIFELQRKLIEQDRLRYVQSNISGDMSGLWMAGGMLYDSGRAGGLFFGEKTLDTRTFLGLRDTNMGHRKKVQAERMGDIVNNFMPVKAGDRAFGSGPMWQWL